MRGYRGLERRRGRLKPVGVTDVSQGVVTGCSAIVARVINLLMPLQLHAVRRIFHLDNFSRDVAIRGHIV